MQRCLAQGLASAQIGQPCHVVFEADGLLNAKASKIPEFGVAFKPMNGFGNTIQSRVIMQLGLLEIDQVVPF